MSYNLSKGAPRQMLDGNTEIKPVLQCIGVRMMQSPTSPQARYRIAVSDGEHYCSAMLATQLNDIAKQIKQEGGQPFLQDAILRLDDFLCNELQGRRVIIVLGLTVLGSAPSIGQPVNIDPPRPQQGQALAPRPPPQQPTTSAPRPYGVGQQAGNGYGAPRAAAGGYGQALQQQQQGGGAAPGGGGYGAPAGGYGGGGGGYGQPAAARPYGAPQGGGGGYGQANGVYGAAPPGGYGTATYQQPAPQYNVNRGGPTVKNEAAAKILPITALNAYQTRWHIKARVTSRSEMRRFSGARGEGKVFSFDLVDASGGEIRCTAFNDTADKFYEVIHQGEVYIISKASLKPKNARFNHTNHDFEITLENATTIEHVQEQAAEIPQVQYSFRPIGDINSLAAGSILDLIGVVESCEQPVTLTRKDGTEATKRSMTLRDTSKASIELTLWGQLTEDPGAQISQAVESNQHPVLAVKAARVGDFNGKSLSTISTSRLTMDPPDLPEAGNLRNWYNGGGATEEVQALSSMRGGAMGRNDRRAFLSTIKDEGLGMDGQGQTLQVASTVSWFRTENQYYQACTNQREPGKACNKKLQQNDDGWFCETCGRNSTPEYRWMLNVRLADFTQEEHCSAFQEAGDALMGMTAAQMHELEQQEEQAGMGEEESLAEQARRRALFRPWLMRLRISQQTYRDDISIRKTISSLQPLDFVQDSKQMIEWIRALQQGRPILQQAGGGQGGGAGYGGPPVGLPPAYHAAAPLLGVASPVRGEPVRGRGYQGAAGGAPGAYGGGGGGYGGGGYGHQAGGF